MTSDKFMRELQLLDPVGPDELDGAVDAPEAVAMLERILSLELDPADHPLYADDLPRRRGAKARRRPHRRTARVALAAVALVVAAAGILALLVGLPGGGGDGRTAGSLGSAAAAAESRTPAVAPPFTYLKTREVSVSKSVAGRRSWWVYEPTMREEWVGRDGSGRLRTISGPSRFVAAGDRAEWEAAGHPSFLTLGFGRRTEDRWLASGLLPWGVEELPAEPLALATRLRYQAETEGATEPVPATTLGLIAEYLRDPAASPALRQALYKAVRLVPGIEYLGEEADPEGRVGIAVGVPSTYDGGPARYSLIFDPETSAVLATETSTMAPDRGGAALTLVRASAFLESRGIASKKDFAKTWLRGLEPGDESAQSLAAFLVYRLPRR
jgi:hypothetical protein